MPVRVDPNAFPDDVWALITAPGARRPTTKKHAEGPVKFHGVPIRSLSERIADYALVAGGAGAASGVVFAAVADAPVAVAVGMGAWAGARWAAAAASFIGFRHVLTEGRWQRDQELVSGISAALVGVGFSVPNVTPRTLPPIVLSSFAGGCIGHYAHRHWLCWRLDRIEGRGAD